MENENQKIGIGLLVLGIVLMLVTFYFAVNTLLNPAFIGGFSDLLPATGDSGLGNIMHAVIFFVPAVILFVMGGIAGRILKHAIVLLRSKGTRSVSRPRNTRQRPARSENSEAEKQEDKKEF